MKESEKEFHDNWASGIDPAKLNVHAFSSGPSALENKFIFSEIGSVVGKKVLDIGCGAGESSVMFAMKGADVTATDLSQGMLDVVEKLAEINGVVLKTSVLDAEYIDIPENSYDIVYAANVIHHINDKQAFYTSVKKLLKPGGFLCTWDPIAYNPIINIYRKMAKDVRSHDEYPLTMADKNIFLSFFPESKYSFFWISALILFLKYFIVDRINPNSTRYWKRIYSETEKSIEWLIPFWAVDRFLAKVPGVRWLAWNVAFVAKCTK